MTHNIGVVISMIFASAEKGFIGPTVYTLSDEYFIENLEVPIPLCNEDFTLPGQFYLEFHICT